MKKKFSNSARIFLSDVNCPRICQNTHKKKSELKAKLRFQIGSVGKEKGTTFFLK